MGQAVWAVYQIIVVCIFTNIVAALTNIYQQIPKYMNVSCILVLHFAPRKVILLLNVLIAIMNTCYAEVKKLEWA